LSADQAQLLALAFAPRLQQGDLVFRRGRGFWSETFSDKAGSNLSHVGVLIHDQDGWGVVHAEADDLSLIGGVQRTPLALFLNGTALRHVRRIQMPEAAREKFVQNIREHLRRQTPFDTSLSLEDDATRVYCSELIWSAAQHAGIELARPRDLLGKSYITIDDLFFSPLLTVVSVQPH
jgi:cell wall-associated NlpC family hydrolase